MVAAVKAVAAATEQQENEKNDKEVHSGFTVGAQVERL